MNVAMGAASAVTIENTTELMESSDSIRSHQMSVNAVTDFISAYSWSCTLGQGNQLLALALPIVELGAKLKELPAIPDKSILKQLFVRQVELFLEKIQQTAFYTAETIHVACYVICVFVDEAVIFDTTWGNTFNWEQDGLLSFFLQEVWDGKKFFVILNSIFEKSGSNFDLLELMYMCLSLGFMGKYRTQRKGNVVLKELCNDLYECIARYRKIAAQGLLVKPDDIACGSASAPLPRQFFSRGMWLIIGTVLVIGCGVYLTFNAQLNQLITINNPQ